MNLLPTWACLPPGNAFPYSLTRGLKFYKLTVLLRRPFKHLVFMRIRGNLQNEFEHMEELNLKTYTQPERQAAPRLWRWHGSLGTVNPCAGLCCLRSLRRIIVLRISF